MQQSDGFFLDITTEFTEQSLMENIFPLKNGDRIFFHGDLGAGKSTFIRALLRKHLSNQDLIVRSPTYTYFQKYGDNIYHFDLYRLDSLDDFFHIGGDDIFENPNTICLIEWPEILGNRFPPTSKIYLEKKSDTERRLNRFSQIEATE